MRWLVLALLCGCHAGGGPVIAISEGGLRLGAEASGGIGPVASTLGATTAVTSREPTRGYLTLDPGYMSEVGHQMGDYDTFLSYGGTLGYATNDDENGRHWAVGAWAAPIYVGDKCGRTQIAFSAAVGVRLLGGITEFFVAPKLSGVSVPCID